MFLTNFLHDILAKVLPWVISIIDIIGIIVIVGGLGYAVYLLLRKKHGSIVLGKAIYLGLDIFLCGEILKTIIVSTIEELTFLALLVLVRTIMAVVDRWKLRVEFNEEKEQIEISNLKRKANNK